jgi:nitroreductase
MVVTDPAKRAALADLYREVGSAHLQRAVRSESDPQTRRVYENAFHLSQILERVPVLVIPCIERRFDNAGNPVAAAAYGSILPAAWSFLLALRSRGLGSTWTTLHLLQEHEVAELLGIPADVTQVALFPVAYTVGDEFKPARRRPVEEITFWDTWGQIHPPTADR